MSASLQTLSQKYDIWPETLSDILEDLQRPWRDPRDDLAPPAFSAGVMEITDLQIGMSLQWVVRNITDFGAFVDIGLHNDGLVHKSQLSDTYVTHPMDVVSLWQSVTVHVLEIDFEREKVSLSMKTPGASTNTTTWAAHSSVKHTSKPATQTISKPETTPPSALTGNITFTSRK